MGFFKRFYHIIPLFLFPFILSAGHGPLQLRFFLNKKRIPSNVYITLVNSSFLHALPNEIAVSYPDYGSG